MPFRQRIRKYIGDRAFYKALLTLALPVMLQNGLTNFVSLLDNIMVGAVGTDQMSGVSIANQLLFIFSLCIFGGLGGAGIFTAQFVGKKDMEGVRNTFQYKLLLSVFLFIVALFALLVWKEDLIALFLHEGGETGDLQATAQWGNAYLVVMLFGLLPFAVREAYASTLRECGETKVPMEAGVLAIFINLFLNWVFIFGHLGAPEMGVTGAALATVISRWVECAVIVVWSHRHPDRALFVTDAYKHFKIPADLAKKITVRGMPLLINEALWSTGCAVLNQCYSRRGLMVVAGSNISNTIANLFYVIWMAMGTAVAIMVGQQLGAGDFERAKTSVRRILGFAIFSAIVAGALMFLFAPLFPRLYNTTDEVRSLAARLIRVSACVSPLYAFSHVCYFTLRSGGRTWITFLSDSGYLWAVKVLLAWLLITQTSLDIVLVVIAVEASDILKCVLGSILIKKGLWIRNVVDSVE